MAATATVAEATPSSAPAMMSDAAMSVWSAPICTHQQQIGALQPGAIGLDPGSLRAACPEGHDGLWHAAGEQGRTDVCEYLKSKGLLDLIDGHKSNGYLLDGYTPLHHALFHKKEETARWMVDNGADINAINTYFNISAFRYACGSMSPSFVEELAGKVAPEHLTMCSNIGESPMQTAFTRTPDSLAVVRMLILRGIPARPDDFPAVDSPDDFPATAYGRDLLPRRRELLASLEADLDLNDRTFLGLFLAGGVHAPYTPAPAVTTTTTTATTKRVYTQRPDGGWRDPVTVPCEPHPVVTAVPTIGRSGRVAARVRENHLPKLRGYRNSEVRMEIAAFLGVREAPDLARLRAVRDVVAALPPPEEDEGSEEEEEGDY